MRPQPLFITVETGGKTAHVQIARNLLTKEIACAEVRERGLYGRFFRPATGGAPPGCADAWRPRGRTGVLRDAGGCAPGGPRVRRARASLLLYWLAAGQARRNPSRVLRGRHPLVAGPAFGAWRQARGSRHLARWRAGSALGGALARSGGRRELRRKRARVPISGGSRTGMNFPRQAAALDLQPLRYLAGEAGAVRKGRDTSRTHQRSRPPHLRGRRPGVALHPALSGRHGASRTLRTSLPRRVSPLPRRRARHPATLPAGHPRNLLLRWRSRRQRRRQRRFLAARVRMLDGRLRR